MTQQTLTQLRDLKLSGMAKALQDQLEKSATYDELAFIERIKLLVEHEHLMREQRKQERLIRQARFKLHASVTDIDYQHPRNITSSQIAALAQGDWIHKGRNLLVTGPCGSGKTYLACAIGHRACQLGYSTRYFRLSRLLMTLTQAKADGTYHKQLKAFAKLQLLIVDDWGMDPLTTADRNSLMEIMDDRHGLTSTMIISQLPTDQWYSYIGDNTLADAILDRLMHNAHRLKLKGESMRKTHVALTQNEHLG